jgi:hypothetical protein
LLANVSVVDTPEPASLAILSTGIAGLIGVVRRRRRSIRRAETAA